MEPGSAARLSGSFVLAAGAPIGHPARSCRLDPRAAPVAWLPAPIVHPQLAPASRPRGALDSRHPTGKRERAIFPGSDDLAHHPSRRVDDRPELVSAQTRDRCERVNALEEEHLALEYVADPSDGALFQEAVSDAAVEGRESRDGLRGIERFGQRSGPRDPSCASSPSRSIRRRRTTGAPRHRTSCSDVASATLSCGDAPSGRRPRASDRAA
jgi:hypothetical protein